MKGKPDVDAFIDGSAVNESETSKQTKKRINKKTVEQAAKIYREQKIFRLPVDIVEALRDRAYELSKQGGRRVTETEIVEQAIRNYLDS